MSNVVFGGCELRHLSNNVCCLLIAYGIYVGAYCIRPVRHRMNRTTNQHHNIANPRNSGRMPYAPTSGAIY